MDLDRVIKGKVVAHDKGLPRLEMRLGSLSEDEWDILTHLGAIPSPWRKHKTMTAQRLQATVVDIRKTNRLTREVYRIVQECFGKPPTSAEEVIDLLPWGDRPFEDYQGLKANLGEASYISLSDSAFFTRKQATLGWSPGEALDYLKSQADEVRGCPLSRLRTRIQAEGLFGTDDVELELRDFVKDLEVGLHLHPDLDLETLTALAFYSTPHPRFGYYRLLTPLVTECPRQALRDEVNTEIFDLLLNLAPPKEAIGLWHDTVYRAKERFSPDHLEYLGKFPSPLSGEDRDNFDRVWGHFEEVLENNHAAGITLAGVSPPQGK